MASAAGYCGVTVARLWTGGASARFGSEGSEVPGWVPGVRECQIAFVFHGSDDGGGRELLGMRLTGIWELISEEKGRREREYVMARGGRLRFHGGGLFGGGGGKQRAGCLCGVWLVCWYVSEGGRKARMLKDGRAVSDTGCAGSTFWLEHAWGKVRGGRRAAVNV